MIFLAGFMFILGFFCILALLVYAINEVIQFEIRAHRNRSRWG